MNLVELVEQANARVRVYDAGRLVSDHAVGYPVEAETFDLELPSDGTSPTLPSRPLLWPQLRVGGLSNPNSDARKGAS